MRVIPTLLWKQLGLVKGVGFDSWRRTGPVLPAVKVYNQREVDELILLDIVANQSNDELDFESIEEFGRNCYVPLTIGGGVKNIYQVQSLLRAGADKVSINTAAYEEPEIITSIAKRFGVQSIVASVDTRLINGEWICFSHNGQKNTGRNVNLWVRELEDRGAGEILIASVERDGTMLGYDLALIEAVVKTVSVPVIASGGAGNYQHMIDAVVQAGASAVAASSMFIFTEQTPAGVKAALANAGIPVRESYRPSR